MTDKENDLISQAAAEQANAMWLSAVSHGTGEQRLHQVILIQRMASMLLANCFAQDIVNSQEMLQCSEKEAMEKVLNNGLQPIIDMTVQTLKAIQNGEFEKETVEINRPLKKEKGH